MAVKIYRAVLISFQIVLVGLLFGGLEKDACGQNADSDASTLRIMSFNIRYGSANDGPNHWTKRRDLVAKTIVKFDPDILGTQETLAFQAKFLREQLKGYQYVGRSREARGDNGEQCGVFFKRDRFDQLAAGHFWLSETPDRPGSKSWDSSLPRMATWVKLWDRKNERSVYFLNTHFDHRGKIARQQSAVLIRDFATKLGGPHLILTGDFNAAYRSAPYSALFKRPKTSITLRDTLRMVEEKQGDQGLGTFNGFKGSTAGSRIDWIGVAGFETESASIDRTEFDGRYPSDHFPVTAVVRFPERSGSE